MQPPALLLPPGLWLAQHLACPSLTTACTTWPPPEQSLSVPILVALLYSCIGQMALKQVIFKRGVLLPNLKALYKQETKCCPSTGSCSSCLTDSHPHLLAYKLNFLPVTGALTWWHSLKQRLTPHCSVSRAFQARETDLVHPEIRCKFKCKVKERHET